MSTVGGKADVWKAVVKAIEDIQRGERKGGEALQ